ncbi:hypothetical protein J5N97_022867 [Dioscorea zingiberensis]|uniref:Uncharacterized protein n=1 Tax=Dioscorea zingiberensis TaxID=325984 RepID=A0A9D5HBB1_9LILI|nr:hypothetical protein J5N97_022867 [Dioscorea zingiberensis]
MDRCTGETPKTPKSSALAAVPGGEEAKEPDVALELPMDASRDESATEGVKATGHAIDSNSNDSDRTGQQPEDTEEPDFESIIQSLTAAWRAPPSNIPDLSPFSNPDELASLNILNPVNEQARKQTQPTLAVGPHRTMCNICEYENLADQELELGRAQSPPTSILPFSSVRTQPTNPMEMGPGKQIDVMPLESNEDELISNYMLCPSKPIQTLIKLLMNKIEADLNKASLRQIANSWNIISDEAWISLTNDFSHGGNTNYHVEKAQEEATKNDPPNAPQEAPVIIPKPRGRPRKNKALANPQVATTHTNQTKGEKVHKGRSKRQRQPDHEMDLSNLSTVNITIADWPEEEIITKALKVGVHLEHQEGNAKKAINHMRLIEAERHSGVQERN